MGQRRRTPDGQTRAQVAALHDAGRSAAQIVAALGISKQAVYSHLHNAGRSMPRAEANGQRWERFATVWNAAPELLLSPDPTPDLAAKVYRTFITDLLRRTAGASESRCR